MNYPLALSASLALLAALPAQTAAQQKADPFRFVPADAQIAVRVAAPARWQQQFAATKVAKLIGGEAVAPWVAQFQQGFDQALEDARGKGKVDVDMLQRFLKEYRGEVVVGVSMDVGSLQAAIEADEPPKFACTVALTPDASFDLAPLAAMLAKGIDEEQGTQLRDVAVGEHRLRGVEAEGVTITVPSMIDGHLVMLAANDLDKAAARMLASADRRQTAGGDAAFWAHAELGGFMKVLASFAEQESEGAPFDVGKLLRDLGLFALESGTLSVAASGEHTVIEGTLATAAEDRGLLDMFPASPDAAKLLRYLPAGAETFSTFPVDAGALFGLVEKIWRGLGDEAPISFDDAMATAAEALKVRIKEDLIAHIGGGMLQLQDIGDATDVDGMVDAMEDNPFGAMFNSCYVIALRDGKAFGTSLETALRARGLHAARKTEDYQSAKIHRLRMAGVIELEYAVTDNLLLIAAGHGESTGKLLRGVLDAAAAGGNAELPKSCAETVAKLPKGWVGLSAASLSQALAGIGQAVKSLEDMGESLTDGQADEVFKALAGLAPELERHGLATLIQATWIDPRRIVVRTLW